MKEDLLWLIDDYLKALYNRNIKDIVYVKRDSKNNMTSVFLLRDSKALVDEEDSDLELLAKILEEGAKGSPGSIYRYIVDFPEDVKQHINIDTENTKVYVAEGASGGKKIEVYFAVQRRISEKELMEKFLERFGVKYLDIVSENIDDIIDMAKKRMLPEEAIKRLRDLDKKMPEGILLRQKLTSTSYKEFQVMKINVRGKTYYGARIGTSLPAGLGQKHTAIIRVSQDVKRMLDMVKEEYGKSYSFVVRKLFSSYKALEKIKMDFIVGMAKRAARKAPDIVNLLNPVEGNIDNIIDILSERRVFEHEYERHLLRYYLKDELAFVQFRHLLVGLVERENMRNILNKEVSDLFSLLKQKFGLIVTAIVDMLGEPYVYYVDIPPFSDEKSPSPVVEDMALIEEIYERLFKGDMRGFRKLEEMPGYLLEAVEEDRELFEALKEAIDKGKLYSTSVQSGEYMIEVIVQVP